MKKIVIAIAVIFCAQVALQAYLAVEQTNIEFSALSTTLRAPVAQGQPTLADLTLREVREVEMRTVFRTRYILAERKTRPAYASYRRAAASEPRPTFAGFKPVIITAAPRTAIAAYSPAARPEKRSFTSKAAAVIKKPYDWLKAVASKLR